MKKLEVFQKLINSVKTNCPGVITEEIQAQFNTEFDDAIASVQNDAYKSGFEKGQQDGFKDGYAQAKQIADENLKAETDKIIAQCDDQAVAKITEILQAIDEQNTEKLQVVYQLIQDYRRELEQMDADHADKLNQVKDFYLNQLTEKDAADAAMLSQYAEAVDKDHAKKLKMIVESISKDHAAKLNECVDFIDAKHAKQLKVLMESVDKDHAKKLQQIVESINDDHAKKLNQIVEAIDKKHAKQLKVLVEAIDRDHTKKLKTITEGIDRLHANKLNLLVESIDEDHTKKLQNAVKHEKDKKIDVLVENVEKYLNYALEEKLPKKQLISEQKYNIAMKTLDKFKDYLNVNGVIQQSKEGIFTDYEKQINSANEKANKLISENAQLQKKLEKREAQLQRREAQIVLQDKLKDCTPAQVKYLRVRFKNAASPKVIQESIEDAKATFKKLQAEKRAKVQAEMRARRSASASTSSVVLQSKEKEPVKKEEKKQAAVKTTDNIAEFYANYLKKQK